MANYLIEISFNNIDKLNIFKAIYVQRYHFFYIKIHREKGLPLNILR